MPKEETEFVGARVPKSLVEEIDAASPNRSKLIIRALRAYFGHPPTPEEISEAERIVDDAARAKRGEVAE
jgi:metal-responsive CopG/Arc/MetJ family transcriptional regulator